MYCSETAGGSDVVGERCCAVQCTRIAALASLLARRLRFESLGPAPEPAGRIRAPGTRKLKFVERRGRGGVGRCARAGRHQRRVDRRITLCTAQLPFSHQLVCTGYYCTVPIYVRPNSGRVLVRFGPRVAPHFPVGFRDSETVLRPQCTRSGTQLLRRKIKRRGVTNSSSTYTVSSTITIRYDSLHVGCITSTYCTITGIRI